MAREHDEIRLANGVISKREFRSSALRRKAVMGNWNGRKMNHDEAENLLGMFALTDKEAAELDPVPKAQKDIHDKMSLSFVMN